MDDYRTFELEEKFMDADNMIKDNYIAEAVRLLNEILAEAPDFGKAHNHLGWIYETKIKDYDKATEYYRLALKFSPDMRLHIIIMPLCFLHLGNMMSWKNY
jgi:tetratricopeptide (TPR) repeat protein